jgi:chromosome partitioning protein
MAHSVLVMNPKGGCGKTTLATNLASYFANRGFATALYDFDRQRSSLHWLDQRPDHVPDIGKHSGWQPYHQPEPADWVVIDSPAQVSREDVRSLVTRADHLLIPVLPSPIDIHAAADFVAMLLLYGKIREAGKRIGVVANRVRTHTRAYAKLLRFLNSLGIPMVAVLRDTQNYIKAAEQGLGVFELHGTNTARDQHQWRPLLQWLGAPPLDIPATGQVLNPPTRGGETAARGTQNPPPAAVHTPFGRL